MTEPKPTGNAEFDLLIKLMGMTTATEDTVALVAIRKANELLVRKGYDWDGVLRGRVKVVADPFNGIAAPQRAAAPSAPRMDRPPPPPPPSRPAYQATPPRPSRAPPPNPAAAQAAQPMRTGMSNRFGGDCRLCGQFVPTGLGKLMHKNQTTNKWVVECDTGFGCEGKGLAKPKRGQAGKKDAGGLGDWV